MKQILQNLKTGATEVVDVPCPIARPEHVLIQTRRSLLSPGTERTMVEFGKGSLIAKARSQPDKVKQVLDKIKTDGLTPTLELVFKKLDEPMPMGYCNAGVVLEAGPGVSRFAVGDRVANNGPHAEIVCVPQNLCAKIPDGVTDDQASFTVLSSIGLQGIRLLAPTLGEKFVVYGMGLIGLLSVQLLRAHGCDVLGVDLNAERLALAERFGAATVNAGAGGDPIAAASAWTEGRGVDGVLVTAAAKTDEIMHQAADMCRKRGRIVLVGVVGLNLRRSDFYKKELTFQVSCSYGPGRYDETYEQGGRDYPYGLVRWTEQRNFEAILSCLKSGQLIVDDLVTDRYAVADAPRAYEGIGAGSASLGVMLEYPQEVDRATRVMIEPPRARVAPSPAPPAGKVTVGVIGAGDFSKVIGTPALKAAGARVKYVADIDAAMAQHVARKNGVEQAITDYRMILDDPEVHAVLVAVRHNLHARFVCEALEAGKHAFVEKPLAMNEEELVRVIDAVRAAGDRHVMVGFNRRFSVHSARMRELLKGRSEPLCMNMTVNAGILPADHWVHDPVLGGGRIIGEACHFIDLLAYLAGSSVRDVAAAKVGAGVAVQDDKMSIALSFADGSVGTVNYFANGSKQYPKETLELFSDGRVLRLENFRRLVGYGFKGFRKSKTGRQDKGHFAEFAAFVERLSAGGPPLIAFDELVNVTLATFAAMASARFRRTIPINAPVLEPPASMAAEPCEPATLRSQA